MKTRYILFLIMLSTIFIMCDDTEKVVNIEEGVASDFVIDVYDQERASNGTTLFTYRYDTNNPKIVEVDMDGNIVWQYELGNMLRQYIKYGFDAESLGWGRVLVMLPACMAMVVNRGGNLTWGYTSDKVSHDVDWLDNGNVIMVFGANDQLNDMQITEVDQAEGFVRWQWSANEHFKEARYMNTYKNGWTGTNAVTRMENGHTMVCLCNFHLIAELDSLGNVLNKFGEGLLYYPHDPEFLENGNILVACQKSPNQDMQANYPALEFNPLTNEVVWKYDNSEWFDTQLTRDANRLSNGNTLITGSTQIIEVTPEGEIVWRLKIKDADLPLESMDLEKRGFYKSQRIY